VNAQLKKTIDRYMTGARMFPWREAIPRMFADLLMVNLSAVLAMAMYYAMSVGPLHRDPTEITTALRACVARYWWMWSLFALISFHLAGFYTRTRGYIGKHKNQVILRAVSIFIVGLMLVDYFLSSGRSISGWVALLSWIMTLATVGGSRLAKDIFLEFYDLKPKDRMGRRKVERVLVVGGAGYLGSTLVPLLLNRNYRVRVLDSLMFGDASLKAVRHHPNFELRIGDVRDIEAVVGAMKSCDAVIHLAAIVGDPACDENKPLAAEINRAATRMLIDIARGFGVQRFLFASTCSVYGACDYLVDEHTAPAPLSVYAHTKVDSENLLLESADDNFTTCILRMGTLFGLSPRLRFDLVVNLLTGRAATIGKITVFNGQQWRPFVHVKDAARAFILALETNPAVVSKQIFNVGDYNLNYQLSQVSETIAQIVPTVEVQHVENSDHRNYRVSFDKIHTRLGFVSEMTLENGIREIYEAILSDGIHDVSATEFSNLAVVKALSQNGISKHSKLQRLHLLAELDGAA
jgi:nucleoside-diphosphate-sugar epimerase